jgi:hypothetical protein
MHDNDMLAASGKHLTELDNEALAAIAGGFGPLSRIIGEVVTMLWDCVKEGLDDVISAAGEGYDDAQAS